MKKIVLHAGYFFFSGVLLFLSCKKEIVCEDCLPGQQASTKHPPIAQVGSEIQVCLPLDSILADGSQYVKEGRVVRNYQWTKIAGPASFLICNPTAARTVIKNLVVGIYQFELKVSYSTGRTSSDTVSVVVDTVTHINHPPVANAGPDQLIPWLNNIAFLDGSASTDPDQDISGYVWSKISGPYSAAFSLANARTVLAEALNLVTGDYEFELKVTDAVGLTSKDTVHVKVDGPPILIPCEGSQRQLVAAQLIPFATLSSPKAVLAIASAGNKILFAGGTTQRNGCSNSIDILDVQTNAWSSAQLLFADCDARVAVNGNKVFIAEGNMGGNSTLVQIYDAFSNSWTTINLPNRPYRTGVDIAAAAGNKVLFVSGNDYAQPPSYTRYTFVDIFDIQTNSWDTDTLHNRTHSWPNHSMSDAGIAATVIGNKIYLAGNASDWLLYDFGSYSSTINVFDVMTESWSTTYDLIEEKGYMASISVGNKNIWAGGVYKQPIDPFSSRVEIRDMVTGTSTYSCLFQPNAMFDVVRKNSQLVFFTSDIDAPSLFSSPQVKNKFDIFDMATNTWSIGVLPLNIKGSSIISVNNEIYVAGGFINGILSNQVWKLRF